MEKKIKEFLIAYKTSLFLEDRILSNIIFAKSQSEAITIFKESKQIQASHILAITELSKESEKLFK